MIDTFQGDPAIKITENGATLVYINGQPVMDHGLHNQAQISLFTDAGWPGNYLLDADNRIGSNFEALAKGPYTLSRLSLIEKEAAAALESPLFGNVTVTVSNPESWRLAVTAVISPRGKTQSEILLQNNGLNWIGQALSPAGDRL